MNHVERTLSEVKTPSHPTSKSRSRGHLVKSRSSASHHSDVSRLLSFPFLLRLENLPHLSRKRFCRERLLNQCYAWFQDPVMDDGVIRVPRHVQHLHLRKAGY